MEFLVSAAIGLLTASGLYLILRPTTFSVVLGLTLLSYAVNALIFFGGRLGASAPPLILPGTDGHADPLPQALVLTAIVIGFGMTAYLVALALKAKGESGNDHVDAGEER
ncbi:Na+/H+ antiporter subunit C [Bradyrhizobium sp.]|uniref:Na+/H+ antiporter subunit C n=1 Tax=Bradyrhizobium sp. TaxID=376 RepID=UPI0027352E40|nr:Na+/H+ antiporter subunit C [Bradyrhizobium sp.]MDP3693622.1 Na+/H+ antiporter subunit C [Bradyrhizobium sp.]